MYNKYIYMEFKPYNIYLLDDASEVKKVLVFGKDGKGRPQYVNTQIYPDDNILNVKHKIVNELEDKNMDNYCFFYKQETYVDLKKKFEILSNNNYSLSKRKFDIFVSNHNIEGSYDDKEEYDIEDFLKLNKPTYEITRSLDYDINIDDVMCDPLKNTLNYIEKVKSKRANLLFENGEIKNNSIYCVHVSDCIKHARRVELDIESMISVYYNSLYDKNIVSEKDITSSVVKNTEFIEYNTLINSHIDFYNKQIIPKKIHKKCEFYISSLNFVYYTKSKFIFPHEVFFKQVHATETTPFIKYNPGSKMENIYRLYCPHKDINGKKVPAMSKNKVFKFMDNLKKNKYISLIHIEYIEVGNTTYKKAILIEINEHGHIFFNVEKVNAQHIDDLDVLCKSVINKTIAKLIQYFDPTKTIFEYFDNLYSDNIDIVEIKYKMLFDNLNKDKIERALDYFPGILHGRNKVLRKSSKNSIYEFNYKRVSNYNKFNDIESEVIELFNKQIDYEAIIQIISFYFDDYDQTKEYIDKVIEKINIDNHLDETGYITKVLRIKSNPGFTLTLDFDEQNDKFYMETVNINNLDYLPYINVYVLNFLSFILDLVDDKNYDSHFSFLKGNQIKDVIVEEKMENKDGKMKLKDMSTENDFKQLQNTVAANDFEFSNMLGDSDEEDIDFDQNMNTQEEGANEPVQPDDNADGEVDVAEQNDNESSESESESSDEESDGDDDFSVASNNGKKSQQQPESDDDDDDDDEKEEQKANESGDDEESDGDNDFSVASNNGKKSQQQQPESDDDDEKEEQKANESGDDEESDGDNDFSVASNNGKKSQQQPESDDDDDEKEEQKANESGDDEESDGDDDFSVASNNGKKSQQQPESVDEENNSDDDDFSVASTGGKKLRSGGSKGKTPKTKNIKNMKNYKLTPNPFSKKIEKHQPLLYVKEEKGNYKLYSRSCPWSDRRTPVLLTQEEKDYIDTHHKDSYDHAVQYGTNPLKEKYWYICPRYWNVHDGVPVKEEDVDPETIIDENAKSTDLSKKYIFQFSKKGKYNKKIPGFLDSSKHEHGMFMPCCFNVTDGPEHKNRIKEVEEQMRLIEESGLTDEQKIIEFLNKQKGKPKTLKHKIKTKKDDDYILSQNFFPLDYGRYGLLPVSLEKFIGFDCKSCFSDKHYKKIKPNTPCLLRYGVENDIRKSFLACLAMLFLKDVEKTVHNLIEKIKSKITIDNILMFHNGNLPKLFYKEEELKNVNLTQYEKYNMFDKLKSNENQLKILINGYENFIKYIEDNKEKVDYYYIWDIVTSGLLNEYYENKRLNLIIIKDNNDDDTNNLSIVCPTPGHSKYFYKHNRLNIVIYHKNEYFEPIVEIIDNIVDKKVTRKINKFFSLKPDMFIYELLNKININIVSKCDLTMPNEFYEFEENIDIFRLLLENGDILQKYKVIKQIINYDNKVIGVQLRKIEDNKVIFVPLKQSSVVEKIGIEVMNDSSYWEDYNTTRANLNEIAEKSNHKIKCKPKFKVVEDSMIVGFLTNGNQFVRLDNPIQNDFEDDIPIKNDFDQGTIDDYIYQNYGKEDEERNEMVQNMKLEKYFYNAYCDTMKMIINKSKHISIKNKIIDIIKNKDDESFESQQEKMYSIIEDLTNTYFIFTIYDKKVLKHLTDINVCSKYSENQETFCTQESGLFKLMIPEYNLYTKEDNKEKYVSFLTYDILLNTYIKNKLFRDGYNIYDNINYKINKNEMLILEKLLRKYFKNLKGKKSEYIQHNVFENMIPDELAEYLDYKLFQGSLTVDKESEETENSKGHNKEHVNNEEKNQGNNANSSPEHHNRPQDEGEKNYPEVAEPENEGIDSPTVQQDEGSNENVPDSNSSKPTSISLKNNNNNNNNNTSTTSQKKTGIRNDNINIDIEHDVQVPQSNNGLGNQPNNSPLVQENSYHSNNEQNERKQQNKTDNNNNSVVDKPIPIDYEPEGEKVLSDSEHEEEDDEEQPTTPKTSKHSPIHEELIRNIDEVLDEIKDTNVIQIEQDELEKSKTTNFEEYRLKELPNNDKIPLKFPKKMSKIRLNIADIRNKIKNAKKRKNLKPIDVDHVSTDIDSEIYDVLFEKGLEAPKDTTSTTTEKINQLKETTKRIKLDSCIKVGYLTSNWKKYFPKLTSRFTFSNNPHECNYNLMMYIMKSHNMNLFKNINKYTIKELLIKYYKMYIFDEETKQKIFTKLVKEGKKKYINMLVQGTSTLETIIHDDGYQLSETDYLLLSYHLKIPIIICYQSKNRIKISHFAKNNMGNKSYYFIKASVRSIMYLFSYRQKLHINKDVLHQDLQQTIEHSTFKKFEDYLFTKMRK